MSGSEKSDAEGTCKLISIDFVVMCERQLLRQENCVSCSEVVDVTWLTKYATFERVNNANANIPFSDGACSTCVDATEC
jgi:hypothetical protein